MQKAARCIAAHQPMQQFGCETPLGRAQGVGVPFRAIPVLHRHKGRFTTHGQPHVACHQGGIHRLAECRDPPPLLLGIGLGHAGRLMNTRDLHLVGKLNLTLIHRPGYRGSRRRLGGAGQRNMSLPRHQTRGWVQANPAGPRQIDLAPGMEIGKVNLRPGGTIEGLDVGLELDEVTGNEARGQTHMAQGLYQQPACIAAGTGAMGQGYLGRLHPGLHADQIGDFPLQTLVQIHQEVDSAHLIAGDAGQKGLEARCQLPLDQIGQEVVFQFWGVPKGVLLGLRFQEKIEGVIDRHLGHQVHRNLKFLGAIWKYEPGQIVGERVLLPVDEVPRRFDAQGITEDGGTAMGRRSQTHYLGRQGR